MRGNIGTPCASSQVTSGHTRHTRGEHAVCVYGNTGTIRADSAGRSGHSGEQDAASVYR